jgi:acetyl esterase/lipase
MACKGSNLSKNSTYSLVQDVAYSDEHSRAKMDIYIPVDTKDEPCPCVLLIHGGGWAIGDKADKRESSMASCLTENGYVVASINYKLSAYSGEVFHSPLKHASWPRNIYECKTAVRFIRKNADYYGIDPERIGIIGSSAGGHLALLTAFSANNSRLNSGGKYQETSSHVRCVIDFYGVPDVRTLGGDSFIGVPREVDPEQWDLASPVYHLSDQIPPILIIHGDRDKTVDITHSYHFVELLKQRNADYQFIQVDGGVHSFDFVPPQADLRPAVLGFLDKHL